MSCIGPEAGTGTAEKACACDCGEHVRVFNKFYQNWNNDKDQVENLSGLRNKKEKKIFRC